MSFTSRVTPRHCCYPHHSFLGFTLIELVITVSILLIVAVMVYVGFREFAYRQSFDQFVQSVALSINEQRQETLGAKDDLSHGVHISTTTITYFSGPSYVPGSSTNVTQSIPGGIRATTSLSGNVNEVVFARLNGIASASGTVIFYDERAAATSTITIGDSGVISF